MAHRHRNSSPSRNIHSKHLPISVLVTDNLPSLLQLQTDANPTVEPTEGGPAVLSQLSTEQSDSSSITKSQPINIPPPLKFHPTRARRQFAARLAERQRALQEAQEAESHEELNTNFGAELTSPPPVPLAPPPAVPSLAPLAPAASETRAFPRIFSGSPVDGESPTGLGGLGKTENAVEEKEKGAAGLEDPRSDDSMEGDGEDIGIVMRKSVRSGGAGGGLGLAQLGLGRFGLGSPSSSSSAAKEGEASGGAGANTDKELTDVFEKLEIDVDLDEVDLEEIDVEK